MNRRCFLGTSTAAAAATVAGLAADQVDHPRKAQIAITLDLEMSRHYPRRGMLEWDYQKGNLDNATKQYSVKAARVAADAGAMIHFFCVGRVLEQEDVHWLREIAEAGHPIGNHTYDHVNVKSSSAMSTQFRFQRSPWLVRGRTAEQVIRENIRLTSIAMKQRLGINADGFRTPGGYGNGLADRKDLQMMLVEMGFSWVSSKYPAHTSGEPGKPPEQEVYQDIVRAQREAQPFVYPTGLIEIPMSPISDVTAFRSHRWKLPYFLQAVRMAVQWAIETKSMFDFLCHPSCMVIEDPDCRTIQLICDMVNQAEGRAEIVGLGEIARRVASRDKQHE